MDFYDLGILVYTDKELELKSKIIELEKKLKYRGQEVYMDMQIEFAIRLIDLCSLTSVQIADVTGLDLNIIHHLNKGVSNE